MATSRPPRGAETPAPVQHRFFELIPPGTRIDFVGLRFKMLLFSWTMIAVGLAWAYVGGINWGIDFVGGTMVHVKFAAPTPIGDVRAALLKPELGEALVQDVGRAGNEFQIRVRGAEKGGSSSVSDAIKADLREKFGEGTYDVLRVETVGPKVGKDLGRSATLAVLAATLVMGVYIALRFELRFGVGAAIALLHDVLMTFGALAIARMEFDLTTVAALLTVVGYSVHDTVIVSDRIRENMKKMRRESLATVMNISINETLSRTILTVMTVALAVLSLLVFGGEVLRGFSIAMLWGVVIGTYSSLFIAAPLLYYIRPKRGGEVKKAADAGIVAERVS